jgi:hypothetical protein
MKEIKTAIMKCVKVTYESFFDAVRAVHAFKKGRSYGKGKRRLATKKPKRAYKCEVCGKYHITSMKKKDYVPKTI